MAVADLSGDILVTNASLETLETKVQNLEKKALDLKNNATSLQEANVEGSLLTWSYLFHLKMEPNQDIKI